MECLHPLFGVPAYKNGVFKYDVVGSVEKVLKEEGIRDVAELLEVQCDIDPYGRKAFPILIPCGRCINCRLDYSRQWAFRLCLEKSFHEPDLCWFLTLTYDDDHLPKVPLSFDRKFVRKPDFFDALSTVRMQDCSDFVKNLRRQLEYHYGLGDGFRFYAASEYGDRTFRPHIHMIAFNLPLEDLKIDKPYYSSDFLDKVWAKGHVCIGAVEFSSCAYVSRYVTKKLSGALYAEKYEKFGIEPESTRCSRNPGIGMMWFDPAVYGDVSKSVAPGRVFNRIKAFDRKLKDDDAWAFRLLPQQDKARAAMILSELQSPLKSTYVNQLQNRIYEAESQLQRKKFF